MSFTSSRSLTLGIGLVTVTAAWLLVSHLAGDGPRTASPRDPFSMPRDSDAAGVETEIEDTHSPAVAFSEEPAEGTRRDETASRSTVDVSMGWKLIDEAGRPIPLATISVTRIPDSFARYSLSPESLDFAALSVARTTSRASGVFEVDLPASPFVLHVTHPDHGLASVLGGKGDVIEPRAIVLTHSDPILVRVVDGLGQPASGVSVTQTLDFDESASEALDLEWVGGMRCFVREEKTDERGLARFSPWPGVSQLQARAGDRLSERTSITGAGELTLELSGSFVLEGVIECPLRPDLTADARLSVFALVQDVPRPLGTALADGHGRLVPSRWPRLPGAAYVFIVTADRLVSRSVAVDESDIRDVHELRIVTEPGHSLTALVSDMDGKPVAGAVVSAAWHTEDTSPGSGSTLRMTRADGRVVLRGCPEGAVWIAAQADGFADYAPREPVAAPLPTGNEVRIHLERSVRLSGRVIHDGEPVTKFRLVRWTNDVTQPIVGEPIIDEEGRFELDAPEGPVSIYAVADELGQSSTVVVDSTARELELEIASGASGRGRVVDGATGQPIGGARIQAYSSALTQLQAPIGEPALSGADGGFELPVLGAEEAGLFVTADGYGKFWSARAVSASPSVDLGDIPLFPLRTLRIELRSKGPARLRDARLQISGPITTQLAVPPNGQLEIPGAELGEYRFTVQLSDGSSVTEKHRLTATGSESLSIDLTSMRGLVIEAHPDSAHGVEEITGVYVTGRTPSGAIRQQWIRPVSPPEPGTREVRFEGVPPSSCVVDLYAREKRLGTYEVEADGQPVAKLVLRLGGEMTIRVRAVDAERRALAGTQLLLYREAESTGWSTSAITDDEGRAVFEGLAKAEYRIHVYAKSGFLLGATVDGDREHELVVEGDHRVAVRLVDEAGPLEGVMCRLVSPGGMYTLAPRVSDASGVVAWDRLSQGQYGLLVDHAGYFCPGATVISQGFDTEVDIQVRRTGGAAFAVRDGYGEPVAGAWLRLWSVEFEQDVSRWMAGGDVRQQPLVSSVDGLVRLAGLPRGEYLWSLRGEGVERSGRVTIRPSAEIAVDVKL